MVYIAIVIAFILVLMLYILENYLKKDHKFSCIVLLCFVILIVGGNAENADMDIYKLRYSQAISLTYVLSNSQWAQALLMYIGNIVGINFEIFRVVYYSIGLILIFFTAKKYLGYSILFIICYMIFPMVIDATQMKNFMAMSIIVFAIPFLGSGKIKDRIIYILLCVLSAGFHIAAFIYLPLVIFCDTGFKTKYRVFTISLVVLFTLIFSNRTVATGLSETIINLMDETLLDRTEKFFNSSVNNGYLVYFAETFLLIIIMYLCRRQTILHKKNFTVQEQKFIDIVYMCTIYALAFFPLYFYRQDFSRLIRNFSILIHIAVIIISKRRKRGIESQKSNNKAILSINCFAIYALYVFYLIFMFYWDILVYYDSVVEPFFNINIFF